MFFFFFSYFIYSENEDTSKVQILRTYEEKNLFYSVYDKDPTPKSKNSFVTIFGSEIEEDYDLLAPIVVLGNDLKKHSPEIDRILFVQTKNRFESSLHKYLSKFWTFIIYRPQLKWPEEIDTENYKTDSLFFIQLWTLQKYSKILYIDPNTVIFSNITYAFNYPPPCGMLDDESTTLKAKGPYVSTTFFLFEPKMYEYIALLLETIKVLQVGSYTTELEKHVINKYFLGRICIFPSQIVQRSDDSYKKHPLMIRSMSLQFGLNSKPMSNDSISYIEIWRDKYRAIHSKFGFPEQLKPLNQSFHKIQYQYIYPQIADVSLTNNSDSIIDPLDSYTLVNNYISFVLYSLVILYFGLENANSKEFIELI